VAEQLIRNQQVAGSSPAPGSTRNQSLAILSQPSPTFGAYYWCQLCGSVIRPLAAVETPSPRIPPVLPGQGDHLERDDHPLPGEDVWPAPEDLPIVRVLARLEIRPVPFGPGFRR
jgi:hypothetical protein